MSDVWESAGLVTEVWESNTTPGVLWTVVIRDGDIVATAALADLTDVDVTSDPPAQDDVLAWDDTENKWTPATLTGGAQNVFTVTSAIAFDLTGLYDLADPAPTPIGWTTAIFGQADPSWNGIWEGQTPEGASQDDLLPLVKVADLPTENGVIVTEYLSYDMDTLMAPGEGGWIIAQATQVDGDAGGIGTFGTLLGDGWSVVYSTQYWADQIATGGADLSDTAPQDLGTAAAGVSTEASRADHVHDMPTAADVGAVADDDARLTDARTPTAHASSHGDGGSDEISIDASQITTGTVGTAQLGTGSIGAGTRFLADDQTYREVSVERRSWQTSLPSVPNVTYTGADTGGTSNLAYGFLFELTEPTIFSAAHHIFSNAGTSVVARPALLRVTNLASLAWTLEIDFGAISVSSTGTKTASITPVTVQPGVFFAASAVSQSSAGQWSGVRAISTVGTVAGTNVANTWRSLWLFTSSAYGSAPADGWPSSGALAGNDFATTPPLLHTLFTWSLP